MDNQYDDLSDHLKPPTFDTDFESGRFGTYSYGAYSIGKPSPVKNFEIDELFRSDEKVPQPSPVHLTNDATAGQTDVDGKKTRRGQYPRKKKQGQLCIKLQGGNNGLNFKLNYDEEKASLALMVKTMSEQPTETSLSPNEFQGLNGLAGSSPFFKKSKCSSCRQTRLVFWFGNPACDQKADRFICVECVKAVTGTEKFVEIVSTQNKCTFPLEKEVVATRKSADQKESRKAESDKLDERSNILNAILEQKHTELSYLLTKMVNCLDGCKHTVDSETKLLAVRFIHDHLESLMKISHMLKLSTYAKKMDCLDVTEQAYLASLVDGQLHQPTPVNMLLLPDVSRKCSGADFTYFLNTATKQGLKQKKKSSFFMEDDDRAFLDKRDIMKQSIEYDEYCDAESDQSAKCLYECVHHSRRNELHY